MNRAEVPADGITYYDEFLSADECRIILEELEIAFWQPSKVIQTNDPHKLQEVLSRSRISHTAYQQWFPAKLNIVLKRIEKRLCRLVHSKSDRLEPWQATRYPFRGKFDYHLDAGYWTYHSAGERMRTFLLYLDTPLKGGETHFRALDISVTAKAGRLLTWDNLFDNGGCNYRMVHSGKPLLKGKKTTLVSWERQKKFRIAAPLIGEDKQ
jgi:prolyl 4-hydroxylase